MTENNEEKHITDTEILARAQEIQADRGGSLVDAMIEAESELTAPKSEELPRSFTVTLHVKPRVARWIVQLFGGHSTFSIEDRLGAYLVTVLNRTRVQAMRQNEPPAEVRKGGAVTLRREHMDAQKG
jgi:hypothetical protein